MITNNINIVTCTPFVVCVINIKCNFWHFTSQLYQSRSLQTDACSIIHKSGLSFITTQKTARKYVQALHNLLQYRMECKQTKQMILMLFLFEVHFHLAEIPIKVKYKCTVVLLDYYVPKRVKI